MITYKEKKVTPKTLAKHVVAEALRKVFDKPEDYINDKTLNAMTVREQEQVFNQLSLWEDRLHKTLGVKLKNFISKTNYEVGI